MTEGCHPYGKPPRYPVICNSNPTRFDETVQDLSFILDHWGLFENGNEDPVLDTLIDSARAGSSVAGSSQKLTLRQLFAVWRTGHLILDAYYNEWGTVVEEKVFLVGMGFGLSGALFWGIVPVKKIIVISNIAPNYQVWDPCKIGFYNNTATKQ